MADTWDMVNGKLTPPDYTDKSDIATKYLEPPYSPMLFDVINGKLTIPSVPVPQQDGAFTNAKNLKNVSIPHSVKKIGEFSFRNTMLTSVKIAPDCEYYPTSFPEGCVITFYGDEEKIKPSAGSFFVDSGGFISIDYGG